MPRPPEFEEALDIGDICDDVFQRAYELYRDGKDVIDSSSQVEAIRLQVSYTTNNLIVSRPCLGFESDVAYWIDASTSGFEDGLLALLVDDPDTLFKTDSDGMLTGPALHPADIPAIWDLLQNGEIVPTGDNV